MARRQREQHGLAVDILRDSERERFGIGPEAEVLLAYQTTRLGRAHWLAYRRTDGVLTYLGLITRGGAS